MRSDGPIIDLALTLSERINVRLDLLVGNIQSQDERLAHAIMQDMDRRKQLKAFLSVAGFITTPRKLPVYTIFCIITGFSGQRHHVKGKTHGVIPNFLPESMMYQDVPKSIVRIDNTGLVL